MHVPFICEVVATIHSKQYLLSTFFKSRENFKLSASCLLYLSTVTFFSLLLKALELPASHRHMGDVD